MGQKKLGETVLKFRQLLETPYSDISEIQTTGKQLSDWLIPPSLQKEIKQNNIKNLIFSLDHVTRYIPMSTLFDGKEYLTENYTISTIISAELTNTRDRLPPGTKNTSVLAAGLSNAVAGFYSLPNVPEELDAIVIKSSEDSKGIFPGLELLNQNFDRKALRDNLANYKILHIATHGEFVPGNAYDSYLLLGNGEKIPIPDIENLRDLGKIHLVVLSACETALGGARQDGTEIAGISYYFLNGGAKAVIASLWQVDDQSTRLLMEDFYAKLADSTDDSPIIKSEALRQAQLILLYGKEVHLGNRDNRASIIVEPIPGNRQNRSNYNKRDLSHPYYWAPFILIGNGF